MRFETRNDLRQFEDMTIWLSYMSYPVTTAVYFERAFRKLCRTVTVGPMLPESNIEKWSLQNMKQPITPLDISTEFETDMGAVLQAHPLQPRPDLFIWIESAKGYLPENLEAFECPTCCYLIDSHLTLARHIYLATHFDYVFIAQRNYLEKLREVNPQTYWLPLACDPEVHRAYPCEKLHNVSFVGSVPIDSRRERLLAELNSGLPLNLARAFWDEMAQIFSASKLVFNNAVNNDLNMRFFEVLSTGSMLLCDMARGSGQSELFIDGEEYACYHDGNVLDMARFYLENEELRERIARRGQRLVHAAHTYRHRVEDMLAVVLSGKPDTFSPEELRHQSLAGEVSFVEELRSAQSRNAPQRSFVIPVLDYSPASEYNILTLLDDLQGIDGEVVVVFNGASVGEELKDHPRITRHAIMKQNVGVARGWNIGLDMSEADTVFILNADAHILPEAVTALEQGLRELPGAACVGPQGAYVNFNLSRDYCYFDKGSFQEPLEVDAVSGFFFAINRRLFEENGIRFENGFTPCYFEEWDVGLQIRKAGFKNYVIPTVAYNHHWSGTIRALRSIPYMGHDETAGEVQLRNRALFMAKWRKIARECGRPDLLESGWKRYMSSTVRQLLAAGRTEQAREAAHQLLTSYPDDFTVISLARYVELS